MKANAGNCPYGRGTLADDALIRHISEMAMVWHVQGRVKLGGNRQMLKKLRELRRRMSEADSMEDHALRWAVQNISQVITALEGCSFAGKLPAVGHEARVRLLARELCLHSELGLSARRLLNTLETFETVEPMEVEELWALNSALKLELFGAFATVCEHILRAEAARAQAEAWAARLVEGEDIAYLGGAWPDAFYERLVKRLNQQDRAELIADTERNAAEYGIKLEDAVKRAQANEARDVLLIRNALETLHMLAQLDWRELSCALGNVHLWLMRDPSGIYPQMDFESRQRYIASVSDIARRAGVSQEAVARACVVCAGEAEGLRRHVGWYLADEAGRAEFIKALGAPASELAELVRKNGGYIYMGAVILAAALIVTALCLLNMPPWFILPAIFPALMTAQTALNRMVNVLKKPRMLPRLELKDGVSDDMRTLVVIPALLSSAGRAKELVRQLETMAATEADKNIDFLLLGDFADSERAAERQDAIIADTAVIETELANAAAGRRRFYYLQRRREFNDRHNRFMAHERKRGALMALNRLLIGGENSFIGEAPQELTGRYTFVITLDADTRVPPGGLFRLIGTMAHPLNRLTHMDGGTHGYALLQPRMELSLRAVTNGFVRLMAGAGGFDPYQRGVSEAYWDLSATAAYAGKGIYDLRAFDARLRNALPDNAILSHDLIEGIIAGAGYVSDAPLYDAFPTSLGSYLKRLHRWTRGDWQLVRYLGRKMPSPAGEVDNYIGLFDRWKILANMLRSLCAPMGFALLLLSLYAGSPIGAALAAAPFVLPALMAPPSADSIRRVLYRMSVWPMEAACQADAIARTIYRVYASGQHMLEWVTAADAEGQNSKGNMRICIVGAALCIPALFVPASALPAAAMAALFAYGPRWTGRLEKPSESEGMTPANREYFAELARATWRFFEEYVSENGLPPDSVQLEPPTGASMRTSPTDTGMYLSACVAARELGFIDEYEMLMRLGRTVHSLEKMDKWRGHPYNWVDIQTLEPLSPRYVSMVDSGNLIACLYLCRSALEKLIERSGGWDRVAERSAARSDSDIPAAGALQSATPYAPAKLSAPELSRQAAGLRKRIVRLIDDMDFKVLYDPVRELFHIGIDTAQGVLSRSYYDMLGSEARLGSFAAIMKGDVPARHFGALGRSCVRASGGNALASWGGTMFEYLMPELFMCAPRNSLLGRTVAAVIASQIHAAQDMPWGLSESGYYGFDAQLNYQYKAFGLPELAMSGGDTGVIAPYASEMAAQMAPREAADNLRHMQAMGLRGTQGFYEAADLDADRLPEGAKYRIVKSYMSHHKGMALMGMANALTGNALSEMFMNLPEARGLALLLEERPAEHALPMPEQPPALPSFGVRGRIWSRPAARAWPPAVLLMAGADANMLITSRGDERLTASGLSVNRWRYEIFKAPYGFWTYVNAAGSIVDVGAGRVKFEPGAALQSVHTEKAAIELTTCLSPADGALLKNISVENASGAALEVEVTCCFEVALAPQTADEAHSGFQSLFVQSEGPAPGAILFRRRTGSAHVRKNLLLCMMSAPDDAVLSCDSSRQAFWGREYDGRLRGLDRPLGGNLGAVLDPCAALRARFTIPPHSLKTVLVAVKALESKRQAADIMEKYSSSDAFGREAELARLRAREELECMDMGPADFFECMDMAAYLAFDDMPRHVGMKLALDTSSLWRLGISGSRSIMLVEIADAADVATARRCIKLSGILNKLGLEFDMVIICGSGDGYRQSDIDEIRAGAARMNYVFALESGGVSSAELNLLREIAAISLRSGMTLSDFLESGLMEPENIAENIWPAPARRYSGFELKNEQLADANGWGGFDAEGGYVININSPATPAPWVNILAMPDYGMLAAENGGGFIWHGSSREGRLTRWRGDALRPDCEQIIYMRDERTGQFASLTPEPCGALPMRVRHMPGETCYLGRALDIDFALRLYCDSALPLIYMRIELANAGENAREISLTGFVNWVMGERTSRLTRAFTRGDCALCAGDMAGVGFASFIDAGAVPEICVNMLEFMGAQGTLAAPYALRRKHLHGGGKCLSVTSPCAALRIFLELQPSAAQVSTFAVGWAASAESACAHVAELRGHDMTARLAMTRRRVDEMLGGLRFGLPYAALERMINDWLPYQTQTSRLWARTGYYQPGGAYGFRDQLQDILAVMDTDAPQARAHILRCAAHQFQSGDVQHWWHEPFRGVRTHISDDMLFLPYITSIYIEHTADMGILEAKTAYLIDEEIPPEAEDIYCDGRPSDEVDTLRGHCLRAIWRACNTGEHGLPLIGSGDWNDGMNRLGAAGRGESVWLGMFICEVLRRFAPFSGRRAELMQRRTQIMAAVERAGWDGRWYRRAYYDDGTPLGSALNDECQIDLLSQAWAALAGLDAERTHMALDAAWNMLVDADTGIIKLLAPPFDEGGSQPGYIKGYLPGIRENGGQYTHAAVWFMMALIRTGQKDRAWQILEMLLPSNYANSPDSAAKYAVEPYVLAADIYSAPSHEGRGGWTWYTGSAAWLTYAVREYMLGFTRRGDKLRFAPDVPDDWQRLSVKYKYGSAVYVIHAERSCMAPVPPECMADGCILLKDDGNTHEITLPLVNRHKA